MAALYMRHLEEDREKEVIRTDVTADEDEETAAPVIRRKVSFADAFGLDLVSVKEFVDAAEEVSDEDEVTPAEEFYLSCLFTAPESSEELERSLEARMVDLESIELLPGTTTLRGTVRVRNLCYSKAVYARITLDSWRSCFDLLADYVPGSSDRKTDRFTFQYTVVPPLEKEGTRVEFCLRYETSAGTFWANNMEMNYVVFCHQKSPLKQVQRSCLKANRRGGTQEKPSDDTAVLSTKAEASLEEKSAEGVSLFHPAEHKPLVASIKSRHRAVRLAHVKDILSHTWGQRDCTAAEANSQKQSNKLPHVLTYHQIPLITLDWDNDNTLMDDIWNGRAKVTLSKEESVKAAGPGNDIWGSFLNGQGPAADNDTSVCDVWQAFINGPGCQGDLTVPQSEWLQTAALVPAATKSKEHVQNATRAASQAQSPDRVSSRGDDRVAAELLRTPPVSEGSVDTPEERVTERNESPKELTAMTTGTRISLGENATRATSQAQSPDRVSSRGDNRVAAELLRTPPVSGGSVDTPGERVTERDESPKELTAMTTGTRISLGENATRAASQAQSPDRVSSRGDNRAAAQLLRTPPVSEGSVDTPGEWVTERDESPKELTAMTLGTRISLGERPIQGWGDTGQTPAFSETVREEGRGVSMTYDKILKPGSNESPLDVNERRGECDPNQRTETEVETSFREVVEEVGEAEKKNEEIVIVSNGTSLQVLPDNPEARVERRLEIKTFRHFPTDSHKGRSEEGQKGPELCDQLDGIPAKPDASSALEDPPGEKEQSLTAFTEALEVIESRSDGDGEPEGDNGALEGPGGSEHSDPASPAPDIKHPSKKSNGFVWWSMLYILSHITQFTTCSLLVAGFVVIVSFYDFPAFFVLYTFSLVWWFYKWKGPEEATKRLLERVK
ncbi:uncharacterized protein [Nerophis lumbriciformis]|uniref:uncharacterized protein n=1 Tax=Nerophis lumbriciformis TaxID=546530 RepID=UPI002AE0077D|nr:uncharacterized protein LOC133606938 [Nerophis lumbriciformis]